ncbi:MAG TPA: YDG domain-containing protein, partial [Marmoricola sp.]|nr:YDG domain-containing protein [Marmoricola sp.]
MCALVALFGLAGNAGAATRSGGTGTDPWVATELPDYSPGDTVSLIGGSWQPGESVHVVVNDDAGQTWSRAVDLTADANGDIADSFTLPGWFVATYSVTATGATSGAATSSFTDGNVRARVAGGPTSASISWEKFNGNATCSGSPSSTGSGTVGTGTTGLGIPSGVDAGQSARLTAPALTGFTFSGWSGAASSSSTTVCVPGSSANQIDMTATYAPGMNTTTVAQSKTATYGDASATLTATVTPASGPAVNSGTVTFTVNGISVTSGTVSGGNASASLSLAGVQAGSYAIAARYNAGPGFNGSNNSGQTPAPTLTIAKAGSSTTVTCAAGPFVYNGSAKTPCSATVTGAGGLNQSLSVSYSDNVHAGTATASASYAGDANHNPSSDSEAFTIDKADSTTTLTCTPGPFVYNGSARTPCSASATGAGGLSQSLAVSYGNNVNAGTAFASATFAGDANHTGSSDSTSFTIDKASSTTTVSCPAGPFVYDGSAQTPCSANVTGAGGLEQSLTVDYADNLHAGTATASASFAGDANHTGSSDSTSFTIDKRKVTASITAADKTYDGSDEAEITGCSLESATDSHGVVPPDDVDCAASNGHFANANAGSGKTVTADVVLSGDDQANYQLTSGTASTSATMEKADLEISAVADSKTYDGTTDSSGTPTVSGLQGGDSVDGLAQRFQSKNVLGAGNSTLEVSAYSVHDGNSGGNYETHHHTAAGT